MPETPPPFSWDHDPLSETDAASAPAGTADAPRPGFGGRDRSDDAPGPRGRSRSGFDWPESTRSRDGYSAYAPPTGSPGPWSTDPGGGARRGVGIAAVIIGSVSVVLAIVPLINYLAVITAVVGLILGFVALQRKRRSKGLGIAGVITSVVALVLSVVLAITYTVFALGVVESTGLLGLPGGFLDGLGGGAPATPGSLADPVPLGTRVAFAGADGRPEWEITPDQPTLDATAIMTGDPYDNAPPPAGSQYAVLPLTITYAGSTIGSADQIYVRFVEPDGTAYAAGDLVVAIPEPLIAVGELAPGASGRGYVAVIVPTDAIATGAWEVSTQSSPPFYFQSGSAPAS